MRVIGTPRGRGSSRCDLLVGSEGASKAGGDDQCHPADDVDGVCAIYPVAGYDGGAGGTDSAGAGSVGSGGKSGVSEGDGTFAKGCGCATVTVP